VPQLEAWNFRLERCTATLGTLALQEDMQAQWYAQLASHNLGSMIPVLRLMAQQSNCFVIVERGGALRNYRAQTVRGGLGTGGRRRAGA